MNKNFKNFILWFRKGNYPSRIALQNQGKAVLEEKLASVEKQVGAEEEKNLAWDLKLIQKNLKMNLHKNLSSMLQALLN